MVPLGEVVRPVQSWNPRSRPNEPIAYVDLSAVDNQTKAIIAPTSVLGCDAPSRARQRLNAGDILVSTVRPNLNSVATVPSNLDGATASTGFTVLRPDVGRVAGRYLFHWVQAPQFVADLVRKATGASYPAVSDRIVKESKVPLPALDEQRRIAAILDKADAMRAKRRQVLAHLDALTQAIFHDMFGDPNHSQETERFGDVASLVGGRNLVADDPDAPSDFRVLKISAVTSERFRPAESKPLPLGYVPPSEHLVRAGDLLMSRANTAELVGAVALVESEIEHTALPDKIWRFVWLDDQRVPRFYRALFRTPSMRRRISQLASGTGGSMKNISKAKLEDLLLPSVPLGRQLEFERRARSIPTASAEPLDSLFAALQSRAFRGEL
ncbi:restriction endonuclease subunit S [Tessaracoccus sp. MC1679]|uniref:restriction endonuclease subunit S n=1 Tax=Tessaracoccus sp. MC1679 TaxID=2760313 RepID=UPI00210259B7|nr:restriction endonuclease subunit S [Tessaracoccus sp. MC1679]